MKKSILILFVFFLPLSYLYSQNSGWFLLQSGTNSELYSVHFEDAYTGWVCGSAGVILKTINGGNNWSTQSSGVTQTLRSVFFTSISTGWAAGDNGILLKTTNSGVNWQQQSSTLSSAIKCLWFMNSTTGFGAGASGKIIRTTNGGVNWNQVTSPVTSDINSIMFIDNNTGWTAGNTGKILKSTNGGISWSINIDHGTISDFFGIYFSSPVIAAAVGRYLDPNNVPFVYFYRTETGGSWWEYIASPDKNVLRSVYFSGANYGWAVGDSGVVYSTTNAGLNWINQNSRTFNNLNSVYFITTTQGFAVGKNGTIIKTFKGGFRDTLATNRRDLGVVPIVEHPSQLINAVYRVQFRPDTSYNVLRSLNNGSTFDTLFSGLTLADTGRYFDGLSVKVKKIKFSHGTPSGNYYGNCGVVQDPVLSVDSIQTRFRGWDYLPAGNNPYDSTKYRPGNRHYQSRSINLSYPTRNTYVGVRSRLNPEDLRKVKIVFTGYGNGQQSYRYLATSPANYSYQDMREVPFKIYEIDETDGTPQPRQLNCAFLEFPDGAQDNKWEPTADSLGGKEVLYIFRSNYSTVPDTPYTTLNLYLSMPYIDVMYVWAPKKKTANSNFQVNDEFYIYPYTVTRHEIAPGYPLYYEFKTQSIIGIEPLSNEIPKQFSLWQNYPNPFNPVTKIRFGLPKEQNVAIRVFDVLGRETSLILNSKLRAGEYETEWDGSRFSSGVYFCRIESESYINTIKMVLIK